MNLFKQISIKAFSKHIALSIGILSFSLCSSYAKEWNINQLTHNSGCQRPKVSGSNLAWMCMLASGEQVFFYNGHDTIQLSGTVSKNGNEHQISGTNVVWSGLKIGEDYISREIFFYDGTSNYQLTDNRNTVASYNPAISGSNIVWSANDGNDREIYFFDGSTTKQITDNEFEDNYPQISGNNITWLGGENINSEIFYYDGNSIRQLTNNTEHEIIPVPQISGSNVVWNISDGNDREIYLFDGNETKQLTNNTKIEDRDPKISGSNVVWVGQDYSNYGHYDVYFYNGEEISKLTEDKYISSSAHANPQISGDNVVWISRATYSPYRYYNSEVFFFDGNKVSKITDDYVSDDMPSISGNHIAWRSNGSTIYSGKPVNPITSSYLLLLLSE